MGAACTRFQNDGDGWAIQRSPRRPFSTDSTDPSLLGDGRGGTAARLTCERGTAVNTVKTSVPKWSAKGLQQRARGIVGTGRWRCVCESGYRSVESRRREAGEADRTSMGTVAVNVRGQAADLRQVEGVALST